MKSLTPSATRAGSDYAKYDDTPRFLTLEALSDILRDIAGYRGYLEMTNAKMNVK